MLIKDISKSFNSSPVLASFSLDVKKHSVVCLMGPSGCGKTTLLNIVAGLTMQDSGTVDIDGETVSYLFQEPRLLPNLTVLENVSVPLYGKTEKAVELLIRVGLSDCLDKYPSQLSGGQRQRVALARAFAFPSHAILMDEPFQNLDLKLRSSLIALFNELWNSDKRTVLWVTHDITEACFVADSIVCVSGGPMKVLKTFEIKENRDKRTSESVAELGSEIYKLLS